MNWFRQQLANVAGTQEPIYGPDAIQPVTSQATSSPFTPLSKRHLQWNLIDSTNVETLVFYITNDHGLVAMAQVIYNSVAGIRTTCQFTSKVYRTDGSEHSWTSDALNNYRFVDDNYSLKADKCSVSLSEDGTSYTIKSSVNPLCIVDIKVTKVAPGFVVGKDGTSYFGTDPQKPWGKMSHAFAPRCSVEGTFLTKDGPISMKGRGCFIHALQGMKPHHLASRWNFVNFQSPKYSALMMEYTTPPSYGSTVVNVGGIEVDGKTIYAGISNAVSHTSSKEDDEVRWPEPTSVVYQWEGKTPSGEDLTCNLSTDLQKRTDRIDVMAEVPAFVKQIVAGAAGTRPYIYQFVLNPLLKIKFGGDQSEERGTLFMEATFIS